MRTIEEWDHIALSYLYSNLDRIIYMPDCPNDLSDQYVK